MKSDFFTLTTGISETTPLQEVVSSSTSSISLTLQQNYLFFTATIHVPWTIIETIFDQAALTQQNSIQAYGFVRGEVPLDYIKKNFKEHLLEHVKEFALKHLVIPFLYEQIRMQKILVAGDPKLALINLNAQQDGEFSFELTKAPVLIIENWKYLPFKSPKRKNYKDLDRQVEGFLAYEKEQCAKHVPDDGVQLGDWVNFDLALATETQNDRHTPHNHTQNFWFKLGNQDVEGTLRETFIGKKSGDTIISDNQSLQEYFSTDLETNYIFNIKVTDTIPYTFFCIDSFKAHFRLKANKEINQKLIEVFSYRNDIPLRRAIVEETLKLLMAKNKFTVPDDIVRRQEQIILETVQENPDYNVYRVQKDFQQRIRQLAERQSSEMILLDQFAFHENLNATNQEVKYYLNFFNRPRMKEFIYCQLPTCKIQGQEVPIPTELIKHFCLREKTINHLIYHLTKK